MISFVEVERMIVTPHENEKLEFKEAKSQFDTESLYKYCVALANEGGGTLLLGVTNTPPRKIVGTHAFPDLDKIKKQIYDKLKFRVDVEEISHPEGRVLAFTSPPRPAGTAFSCDGAYYMRVGGKPCPHDRRQAQADF